MIPALEASNRWALRRIRQAMTVALAHRDRALPVLADRQVLELQGAGGPLEARLYRPIGVPPHAPLMLYFHGGGFVCSDLDTHEALCVRLAHGARIRVLAVSYRLAPEHRFPAQLEDACAVARQVAAEPDFAGAGFLLGGDSAGGYLAASAAACLEGERPGAVRGQLLLYPLLHLEEDIWAESLFRQTRILGWAVVRYLRRTAMEPDVRARSLLEPGAVAPLPTVIVAGGALDPTRADALALAAQLAAAGVGVTLREYPALIHGFGNLTHALRAARRAVSEVASLLGELAR